MGAHTHVFTFSILDSVSGSLKLGARGNPLLQTNIFLRTKDNDFLPMPPLVFSKQTSSFPLFSTMLLVLRWILLSLLFDSLSSDLSSWWWLVASDSTEHCNNKFNSFWSFPSSSDVNSCRWSWEEDEFPSRLMLLSGGWSFKFLFPSVPIASNPWCLSLNWGSCSLWSIN